VSREKPTVRTGILGGVCMAHAPQFFTLPETEDKATVARVRALAEENGRRLAALKPDLAVVIANDHANQFLLHCVAPFVLHRGAEAAGRFAGRSFRWPVAHAASTALLRHLQAEGFDPAFTSNAALDYAFGIPLSFLGWQGPIVPLYVNAYVPPQPAIERCYRLGEAVARGLQVEGISAVVIASGGLSHFPGTERYAEPDIEFDRKLMAELETGNLRWLLSLDERRLDETGNIELRCWAVAAGMLGERRPDMASLEPSWHHNYATLAWWGEATAADFAPHYPPVDPARVALSAALHALATDAEARARYRADPAAYADAHGLAAEERRALLEMSEPAFRPLGIHPFLPFMARLQLEREAKA
jgi:2,3-dihydroxyphenylpropionate 1,2-dioxygenase